MRATIIAALLVLAPAVISPAVQPDSPERYVDRARGWSVAVVAPWIRMDDEHVAAMDAEAAAMLPSRSFAFIAGFGTADDAYPYVLVQHSPVDLSGADFDDIEQAFGAVAIEGLSAEINEALGDSARLVAFSSPRLDRDGKRVLTTFTLQVPGVGEVRGVSVAFLGVRGPVQFNFYAREAEFAEHLPTFDSLLATFAFRRGEEFVPPQAKRTFLSRVGRSALLGGALGLVIGLLGAIFGRRKKVRAAGAAQGVPPGEPTIEASPEPQRQRDS